MVPAMIHEGSEKEPIWFQDGPKLGPPRIQDGSPKEPRGFQSGAKSAQSMIHDASVKESIQLRDGPKLGPSSSKMDPRRNQGFQKGSGGSINDPLGIHEGTKRVPRWVQDGPIKDP